MQTNKRCLGGLYPVILVLFLTYLGLVSWTAFSTYYRAPANTETLVDFLKHNTYLVVVQHGSASAVWLKSDVLLTNKHVCRARPLYVIDSEGRDYPVYKFVEADDPNVDLCLLYTRFLDPVRKPVVLAPQSFSGSFLGRAVYYSGYPNGLFKISFARIVAERLVLFGPPPHIRYIVEELDNRLDPGNSGGPVFNSRRELVGLAQLSVRYPGASPIGAIVPLAQIRDFLRAQNISLGTAGVQ